VAPSKKTSILSLLDSDAGTDPIDSDTPGVTPKDDNESATLKPDPKPRAPRRTSGKRAPQTKVNEVRDQIESIIKLASGIGSVRDPHCCGVLNDQARDIASQVAEQLSTKPHVMEFFDNAVGISGWVKLVLTVKPVCEAIIAHHVTHKVGNEEGPDGFSSPLDQFPAYHPGERYAS
jgi:hypothetical protein